MSISFALMGILQVPIQSDIMFQQICQFFGPQIDSDFAIQKQNINLSTFLDMT